MVPILEVPRYDTFWILDIFKYRGILLKEIWYFGCFLVEIWPKVFSKKEIFKKERHMEQTKDILSLNPDYVMKKDRHVEQTKDIFVVDLVSCDGSSYHSCTYGLCNVLVYCLSLMKLSASEWKWFYQILQGMGTLLGRSCAT